MNELEKYKGFKAELAITETFDEIKLIESKAAAAAEFAKKNKIGLAEQQQWGIFRTEIEAKKGAWLDSQFPSKVNASTTMADAGINFHESSNARIVHNEPEIKDDVINELIKKNKVVTPNAVSSGIRKKIREGVRQQKSESGKNIFVDIDFRLGDFENVLSNIPDGSVDLIITDPPYPLEFIDCWSKLSRFAARKLKPNGFCIAYSGQYNLPEVILRMNENLIYYWTFALYHTGNTQIVNAVNIICRWKPVLIYQNGRKKIENTIQDFIESDQREKGDHNWQQGESGVSRFIELFTKPGDLIVEPFAGSGTTIISAYKLKRNIIGAEIDEMTYNIAKTNINDCTKVATNIDYLWKNYKNR